ncbi:MAG: hypothetical protein N4A44_00915 [Alphaproteobacteria bacterium]|jgi:hypothetical protein|nr:hypothetical protein [Alphaproteobacteria bacterium]
MLAFIKKLIEERAYWKMFGFVYLILFFLAFHLWGTMARGIQFFEFWLIPMYFSFVYASSLIDNADDKKFLRRTVQFLFTISLIKVYYSLYFVKPFDLKNDCAIITFVMFFAYFWIPVAREKFTEIKNKLLPQKEES